MRPLSWSRSLLARVDGPVLVSFSGGKDSLAVLDLCVRHCCHVEAFYMYMVRGISCIEAPLEAACARAGVRLHYVPHWDLGPAIRGGLYRLPTARSFEQTAVRLEDVELALLEQTGTKWIGNGAREDDSLQRRIYLRKFNYISKHRFYPIATWRTRDVKTYLRHQRIPTPPELGKKTEGLSSGFSLTADFILWLKEHHPDDYKKVEQAFPFVGAIAYRQSLSELQDGAVEQVEDPGGTVQPEDDRLDGEEEAQG